MTQNTSSAVMAQRHEPHDSLDDFPTQPWGTRALCEHVIRPDQDMTCWEPACNRGYMVRPLQEYFRRVYASDIHNYSGEFDGQEWIEDFLWGAGAPNAIENKHIDWIITNPPFRLAEQFIERARSIARVGVCMLVRTQFLEGIGRHDRLFKKNPPSVIAQFSERLPLVKGRVDPKVSTATSYCWVCWRHDEYDTRFVWIPPCRKQLERPDDYLS